MEAQLWDDAARAARGIARIARMDEARYSTRLWEWRATVLEGRAARELERRRAEELMRAAGEQASAVPPTETCENP
jgi:broad specificity phosphatase PhoE